jgi:hypothetical protein
LISYFAAIRYSGSVITLPWYESVFCGQSCEKHEKSRRKSKHTLRMTSGARKLTNVHFRFILLSLSRVLNSTSDHVAAMKKSSACISVVGMAVKRLTVL